jgi:lantibiotic modifying enzyme
MAIEPLLPTREMDECLRAVSAAAAGLKAPRCRLETDTLRKSLEGCLEQTLAETTTLDSDRRILPLRVARYLPDAQTSAHRPDAVSESLRLRASQWQAAILELLRRLEDDWPKLCLRMELKEDGPVVALSQALGDLHNSGRSVYRLAQEDGRALVYKPRPVNAEALVECILDWLRERGCKPSLAGCRTVEGHGYGWTSHVEHAYCTSATEASTFFRQQGAFLALFWLLCADDLTSENVIVHGAQPFWVDNECIGHPEIACAAHTIAAVPLWIRDSILTTSMVFSGKQLGRTPRDLTGFSACCAKDRSRIFSSRDTLHPHYIDAAVSGFQDMYVWLLTHPEARSVEHGPLSWLRGQHVRVLLRPTSLYAALVRLLRLAPLKARSVIRREIELVLRFGEGSDNGVSSWPESIVRGEILALERGDVPYLSTNTSSHDLKEAGGWTAHDVVGRTGLECVSMRAARMSAEDLDRQTWLLRSFLGQETKHKASH